MIGLKLVFYMFCFFIGIMYMLGIEKIDNKKHSPEREKGKILLIFATIFLFFNVILGYNLFF